MDRTPGHFVPDLDLIGASERVDALVAMPPLFLGFPLPDVFAILDTRIGLRLIIPEQARTRVSRVLGRLRRERNVDIRFCSQPPSADLLITDGISAAISTMGLPHIPVEAQALHYYQDGPGVEVLSRHFASLWSTSEEVFYENLILPLAPHFATQLAIASAEFLDAILRSISASPQDLLTIDPRRFEELVARLMERDGFAVQLTPPSRDGGRDILARPPHSLVEQLYLVECKRYSPEKPVGVGLVRALYGVVEESRASAGLLVTTSRFTRPAISFSERIPYRISLRDYAALVDWLRGLPTAGQPNTTEKRHGNT